MKIEAYIGALDCPLFLTECTASWKKPCKHLETIIIEKDGHAELVCTHPKKAQSHFA